MSSHYYFTDGMIWHQWTVGLTPYSFTEHASDMFHQNQRHSPQYVIVRGGILKKADFEMMWTCYYNSHVPTRLVVADWWKW